jgi:anaerobic magnesium-protoporphyrin IX monomethyl ester cyclase
MAKVLFIQTDWFEHLGLLYLSACLSQRGHKAELRIGRRARTLIREIRRLEPDLVAMTATTGSHQLVLSLARSIRQSFRGPLILGGPHPTFFPEVLADPGIDMICRGEGETTLADLLERLHDPTSHQDIPGLSIKTEEGISVSPPARLIENLDTIPFPDRDLYFRNYAFFRRSSMRRVITMRGCPYECTYCYNRALKDLYRGLGPYVRQRSVENVLEEIRTFSARPGRGKPRTLNFVDDTFALNRKWTLEFLERYSCEFSYPFIINTRAELLDEELISALAQAGCYCVQIGIETGDETLRREILGRKVSNEIIRKASAWLSESGIRVLTYNMLGLPAETIDQAFATMELNQELRADFPRFSIYQPYPKTALAEKARELGLIQEDLDTNRISESYFQKSVLNRADIHLFENLHKLFYPAVRWPRTRPLLKRLIKVPPNPLFHLAFLISIGAQYARATNRTLRETLELGLRSLRNYFH